MATESAVTPAGPTPIRWGPNSAWSTTARSRPRHNQAPTAVRGNRLRHENDTEAGCSVHRQATGRRPRHRVRTEGALRDVRTASTRCLFQPDSFAVVRDAIAASRRNPETPTGWPSAAEYRAPQAFPVWRTRPSGARAGGDLRMEQVTARCHLGSSICGSGPFAMQRGAARSRPVRKFVITHPTAPTCRRSA